MAIHSNATHLYKYQYLSLKKKTYIFQSGLSEKCISASLHRLLNAAYKNRSWLTLEDRDEKNFIEQIYISALKLFSSPIQR